MPPWPNRITGPKAHPVDADDQLVARRGRRIIGCTAKPRAAPPAARARRASSIAAAAAATACGVAEVERDAADIGLVARCRATGSSAPPGSRSRAPPRRVVGGRRDARVARPDAVGGSTPWLPALEQRRGPRPARRAIDRARASRSGGAGPRRRRLISSSWLRRYCDELHEGAHRVLRACRRSGCRAARRCAAPRRRHRRRASRRGRCRRTAPSGDAAPRDLGGCGTIAVGRVDAQEGVGSGSSSRISQRARHSARPGASPMMSTGLASRPGRRQHGVELCQRLRRSAASVPPREQRVGRQHARRRRRWSRWRGGRRIGRRARQRLDGVEQILGRRDAQHAGAAERGIVDVVGPGQRAGMRRGGCAPFPARPALTRSPACGARRRAPPT